MNTSRRSMLAAGATGALALTAGCVDVVLGNEPLEFEAERVAPTTQALEETGFEEIDVQHERLEETVDVGVERDVRASIWISLYSKEISLLGRTQDAGFFAAVSLPSMEALGMSFNPLEEMDPDELLEEFRDDLENELGELRDLRHDDTVSLPILDEARAVDVFVGETDVEGEPVEIVLNLASFEHEDDLVVLLGGYPEPLPGEGANVEALLESVEHPVR